MKKLTLLLLLLLIPAALEAACPNGDTTHAGNECIVTATGSGSTCSAASPCGPNGWFNVAAAGDQVWLSDTGGIYKLRWEIPASVHGSAGNHIIIRRHCGDDHICDTADDHWPKFDAYQTTTLTANMLGPLDSGYNVDLSLGGGVNFIQVADASIISTANPQDVIHLGTGTTAERVFINGKSGNTLNNGLRAWDGSTAVAHSSGETVKVFGSTLSIYGYYLTIQGVEFYNSYDERAFSSGSAGDLTTKRGSCIFYGNNQAGSLVRLVDLVLHDCNHGLFTSSDSASLELVDVLDVLHGLVNSDPNGLGWYTENTAPATKLFSNIIAINNYSSCGKLYSEALGNAQNFTVQNVICANSGAPIAAKSSGRPAGYGTSTRTNGLQLGGGGAPNITGNTFNNNKIYLPLGSDCFYFGGLWMGYLLSSGTANNNTITNNYVVACQTVNLGPLGTNLTFTGNTIIQPLTGVSSSTTIVSAFRQASNTGWTVNDNDYVSRRDTETSGVDGTKRYDFSYLTNPASPIPAGCCRNAPGGGGSSGSSQLAFTSSNLVTGQSSPENGAANSPAGSGWQEWTGFDASGSGSSYTGGSLPTTNVKGCTAKTYGLPGGFCYIYNWEGQASVTLTISGLGLSNGESFAVFDAQNWTSWQTSDSIVTGTYNSGAPTVSIPMSTLTTVKKPIGTSDTIAHTANGGAAGGFAAVIVMKTADAGGGGGAPGAGFRSRGRVPEKE